MYSKIDNVYVYRRNNADIFFSVRIAAKVLNKNDLVFNRIRMLVSAKINTYDTRCMYS